VVDEISDDFNLIGIVVRNFHADELIFDQYHQLEAIEAVNAKLVTKMRFICNTPDINA